MKQVRKLPPEVCSVMRSGVTIPTPAQGVVELLLNSIDAKALSIAIRIDLKLMKIQVIDNGIGIEFSDLEAIGNRSVTSKCYTLEEYYNNLLYHGYRGEALASLCEMSGYLEIVTRPSDSDATFKKLFVHGKAEPIKISDIKRPSCGTTVTINDFMFNMPVRRCGMKDVVEMEAIRSQVELIALAHPEVSISLRNDAKGRIILEKHKSSDLLSAFEHLFGHTLSRTMAAINFCSDKFKINGYISKESYRHNDLQFIFINKKPIMKTKLHKLVSALLAKSSIIRRNGYWKSKPIPKNVPTEKWLSFPSLEKTRKFAVFVLNITCPRNEYEICWDSRKSSIYFKDWDGIINCIGESIRIFLRTENLVDEEEGQDEEDEKDINGKDASYHIEPLCFEEETLNKRILKCNTTIEPEVETWNMQGAIHGIAAKRKKTETISKECKDATVNSTNNVAEDYITPTFSPSNVSKGETSISVKSDELNSVPPVVKFLEKIETPEFARLKITRGAYRLKMKEEEIKREQRAKKLGVFKFPDKPKLISTKPVEKCVVKRNKTIKVNTKQLKNKKCSEYDAHKSTNNINIQYTKSFSREQNINNNFCCSSPTPMSPSSEVELSHKKNCFNNDFQIASTSSFSTGEIREERLFNSASYDDSSNNCNVEVCNALKKKNKYNSYHHLDENNEKKVKFLIPSHSESEDVDNDYSIGSVQNVQNDSSMTDQESPSPERNIEGIWPESDGNKVCSESNLVSSKVDLKCSKLKISEITLLSIPTPQSENPHKCINSTQISKMSDTVEGNSFDNDDSFGGTHDRDNLLVQFNNNVNQSYQGNNSPFFSDIFKHKQSANGLHNSSSLFSSFCKAFEKEETVRKSSEDLCGSNLAVHSPYFFNLNKSVLPTSQNIQSCDKDLNKGQVNNTPITSSKVDDPTENGSKAKQFFEIFEISALGVNKSSLESSPYFKSKKTCKKSVSFLNKRNLSGCEGNSNDTHERKGNDLTKSPLKLKRSEIHEVLSTCENYNDKNIDSLSSSQQILSSTSVGVDNEKCNSNQCAKDLKSSDSSVSTSDEFIENTRRAVLEKINDENVDEVNEIECLDIDENMGLVPINEDLSLTHTDEDKDKNTKQTLILEESSNTPAEKAKKEMNPDWCPMRNCEGKNFFVHIPSGFTSFNAPASENLENFYGMSKRYEFIPKGMSPILNACSFLNRNLKSADQFPAGHNYDWESSKKNNLKTVKWRNESEIWNNDVSDILDITKSNAENKASLNCSSVPDLSYTCAKMSKILHEEKFSKNIFISIQVIGQLDNKFIVTLVSPDKCTSPHILGLFDQHAVHERIRLETLMKEYSSYENERIYFKSSKLEEPLKLEIATKEYRILVSFGNKFQNLGFHFTSEEDNWIEMQHVPKCLYSRFLRERSRQWLESTLHLLIQDVVQHIIKTGGQDLIFPEVLRDIINSEACKGAIKFGDPLTLEQCKELLLFLSSCDLPFFCAHGRPSFVPIFDFRLYENDRQKFLPMF